MSNNKRHTFHSSNKQTWKNEHNKASMDKYFRAYDIPMTCKYCNQPNIRHSAILGDCLVSPTNKDQILRIGHVCKC